MSDTNDIREKIKKLYSSSDKIFLMGAGCSKCAGLPLMKDLTDSVLNNAKGNTKKILGAINGEIKGNIEDILSQLGNYLDIAKRGKTRAKTVNIGASEFKKSQLQNAIQDTKKIIAKIIRSRRETISEHIKFVKAIHRLQRPGRPLTSVPTYYVVLNYDTLLEDALGFEGISYTDGMSGGATGYWSRRLFDEQYLQAKVLKLHGSLDWYRDTHSDAIRRLPEHMQGGEQQPSAKQFSQDGQQLIIAPAENKYAETQAEPFATLMSQFSSLVTKSTKDTTLFIMGYSFGDEHVNKHIEQALQFNDKLTVIVLACDKPRGKTLSKWEGNCQLNTRLIIFGSGKPEKNKKWGEFEKFVELIGESE